MTKQAISVTLDEDNLTWLRARVGAAEGRSVSDLLDQIVTAARGGQAGGSRSVVGTIEIDRSDPLLERADTAVRLLFETTTLSGPTAVQERRATYGRAKTRRG